MGEASINIIKEVAVGVKDVGYGIVDTNIIEGSTKIHKQWLTGKDVQITRPDFNVGDLILPWKYSWKALSSGWQDIKVNGIF